MSTTIQAREYYDTVPSGIHFTGDIWTHLPTYGALAGQHLASIIITPACDLAQRKVETVTYLPIVSVRAYLCSRAFLPEIVRATEGQLRSAGLAVELSENKGRPTATLADFETAHSLVTEFRSAKNLGNKEKKSLERAEAGINLAAKCLSGVASGLDFALSQSVLGEKEIGEISRRIITNSYKQDIHFLPADEQRSEWSAISEHSVALFRYPMSLPIDILDLANSTPADSWASCMKMIVGTFACAKALESNRPMKLLKIHPHMMSSVVSRFIALYGRIGTPDFSSSTVDSYSLEIGRQ